MPQSPNISILFCRSAPAAAGSRKRFGEFQKIDLTLEGPSPWFTRISRLSIAQCRRRSQDHNAYSCPATKPHLSLTMDQTSSNDLLFLKLIPSIYSHAIKQILWYDISFEILGSDTVIRALRHNLVTLKANPRTSHVEVSKWPRDLFSPLSCSMADRLKHEYLRQISDSAGQQKPIRCADWSRNAVSTS